MIDGPASGPAGAAGGWAYRPALDGLRTLAVYIVIAFHSGIGTFTGGFIGVDLFFVLSGFLVTSVLLAEHDVSGRISLRRFYARRVRRLLPAAVLTIVAVCVAAVFLEPPLTRTSYIASARASLLYVSNWYFVRQATDYFADDVQANPLLHFWSLSLEEQFYVVFPVVLIGLLAFCAKTGRRSPAVIGLGALTAASVIAQLWWADRDPLRAYYGTDARVYQMTAGALLAVIAARPDVRGWLARQRPATRSAANVVVAALVAAFVVVASEAVSVSPSARGFLAAAVAVAVIAALESATGGPVVAVLSSAIPVKLGRISYGTYLWHWPLIIYVQQVIDLSPLPLFVVAAVGASALASLSFWLMESPIRTSSQLARWPRGVVASGLGASVLAALFVVPAVLENDQPPIALASERPEVAAVANVPDIGPVETVPPDLDLAAAADFSTGMFTCRDAEPEACVLERGTGPHVFLLGDSNAAIFVPMFRQLAAEHDFTFSASTSVGCPWQEGLGWVIDDQVQLDDCVASRADVYDRILPVLQPDVVVTITIPRDDPARIDRDGPGWFTVLDETLGTGDEAVAEATARSLDRLTEIGARVVMVEPLPYGRFNPVDCLSGTTNVADCAVQATPGPLPSELAYRDEAMRRDDAFAVDVDMIGCPGKPLCLPMLDGKLVYRDPFHLHPQFLIDHRAEYWAAIQATGSFT